MEDSLTAKITNLRAGLNAATKPQDLYEESKMLMADQIDWGNFIEPAPMAVAILGEIMLVSTASDFKLDEPNGGWKYAKHMNFRPCLLQIAHEATTSFRVAQTNMEAINLLSNMIPERVKDAVKAISQGDVNDELVKGYVARILEQVGNQSNECMEKSQEIVKAFDDVINLINEVQESCMQTKGSHEEKLRQTEISLQIKKHMQTTLEETKKAAEEQYETMKDSFDKAQKGFEKAARDMPSGWELLGMSVVNALTNTLSQAVSAYMMVRNPALGGLNMVLGSAKDLSGNNNSNTNSNSNSNSDSNSDPTANIREQSQQERKAALALNKADEVLTAANNLQAMYGEDKVDWDKVKKARDGAHFLFQFFEDLASQFSGMDPTPESRIGSGICVEGGRLAKVLANASEKLNSDEEEIKEGRKGVNEIVDKAQSFEAKSKMVTGGNTLPRQGLARTETPNSQSQASGDNSLVSSIIQQSQFHLELATQELDRAREGYAESCKVRMEAAEKLGEVMAEIAGLDLQKIDFEKIKEVLRRGIAMLSQLREQWVRLTVFFHSINNLISVTQKHTINNFLMNAEESLKLSGVSMKTFILNQVYLSSFEVVKVSTLVSTISGTYKEVSQKYIMQQVAKLDGLLLLDSEKDAGKIQAEMKGLFNSCTEAQKSIKSDIDKKKANNQQLIVARVEQIKNTLAAALPPPSTEKKEAMEKIVKTEKAALEEKKVPPIPISDLL